MKGYIECYADSTSLRLDFLYCNLGYSLSRADQCGPQAGPSPGGPEPVHEHAGGGRVQISTTLVLHKSSWALGNLSSLHVQRRALAVDYHVLSLRRQVRSLEGVLPRTLAVP